MVLNFKLIKKDAVKSAQWLTTQVRSVQSGQRRETIFRTHTEQSNSRWMFFKKPLCESRCSLGQLKTNTLLPSGLRSHVFSGKKRIRVNYRWNAPFSWSRGGLNWCAVALCQTQTGGQRPHFVSPHERSTRRMLSPSILSTSLSLEWVMRYWNHMPSWIPHGSSHPVQSQQSSAGRGHSAVARGASPLPV